MTTLREAAQQALEALEFFKDTAICSADTEAASEAITALRAALAEPDLDRCPRCGGPADNGHDREVPPNPYYCTKCMAEPVQEHEDWCASVTQLLLCDPPRKAPCNCKKKVAEPVQEPVAWRCRDCGGTDTLCPHGHKHEPLYTAPPQRKPLTEEEIYSLFRTVASPVMFARAIERAHGIGEQR